MADPVQGQYVARTHASRVSTHADGVSNRAVRLPARQHRGAGRRRRAAPAHRRGRLPVHPRADRPRRRPRGAPRGDGAPPGAGRAGRGHPAHGGRDATRRQKRRHETGRLPAGSAAGARRTGAAVVLSPSLWRGAGDLRPQVAAGGGQREVHRLTHGRGVHGPRQRAREHRVDPVRGHPHRTGDAGRVRGIAPPGQLREGAGDVRQVRRGSRPHRGLVQ